MNEALVPICKEFNEKFARLRPFKNEVLPVNAISVNERSQLLYIDPEMKLFFVCNKYVKQLYCDLIHTHRQLLIVNEIKFSEGGELFFIRCEKSVYVYKLPDEDISDNICPGFCVGVNYEFAKSSIYIEKVAWHPLSSHHLVILTSDNMIQMYNLSKSHELAEQSYRIPEKKKGEKGEKRGIVSFTFGRSKSWEIFSLFCVHRDGDLFGICPFIPYGCLIHRSFFSKLKLDEEGKEYLKKVTLVKKNDEFVLTKSPNDFDDHLKKIFKLKQINYYEDESKNDTITVSEKRKGFKCCDIMLLCDKSQTYSCISVCSESGIIKTFLLIDDIFPFCNIVKFIVHSTIDIGIPSPEVGLSFKPNSSKLSKLKKQHVVCPYFFEHPLTPQGILLVSLYGIHEFRFPFLNNIVGYFNPLIPENEKNKDFLHQFSFTLLIQTSIHFRSGEHYPLRGISMIPSVFRGFQILLLDERNNLKAFFIKDFYLKEPEVLVEDLRRRKRISQVYNSQRKNEKSEMYMDLFTRGFDKKMSKLQEYFKRFPKILSLDEELDQTDINKMLEYLMNNFARSHVSYCKGMYRLIVGHLRHTQNFQKIQNKNFEALNKQIDIQKIIMQKQLDRVSKIEEKQILMETRKERILQKLEKTRPLSIQERGFIDYIRKKKKKLPRFVNRLKNLKEKTDFYIGKKKNQELENKQEEEEKNLFFDMTGIRGKMDKTYGDIKKTVENVEKLEKELKDFRKLV